MGDMTPDPYDLGMSEADEQIEQLTRERDEAREQVDALLAAGVRDVREDAGAGIDAPARADLFERAQKAEAEVERLREGVRHAIDSWIHIAGVKLANREILAALLDEGPDRA